MIGTGLALLLGGIASGVGGVAAAKIGSGAAKDAAATQAAAADESIALQREQYDRTRADLEPWIAAGREALTNLSSRLGPGGSLLDPYKDFEAPGGFNTPDKFKAPDFDPKSVQFDPGYEYRMKASNDAIQAWAASKGQLFSGGTGMKLIRNAQDMTSQEYQNAFARQYGQYSDDYNRKYGQYADDYNRKYQQYQDQYSRALQTYGTNRDTFLQNQLNTYNRLAGMAGLGQQSQQEASSLGSNYATNVSNTIQGGANATAAGQVGSANAWGGALSNIGNMFSNSVLLASILGKGSNDSNPNMYPTGGGGFMINPGYAR